MIGPMIVNIHQQYTTVLHEPLLGHRFICGGDHLQLTKVPGVDQSAGGKSSPILQEKVDTLGYISHLDIPYIYIYIYIKTCFFPTGP